MTITLQLQEASEPLVLRATQAYTKGGLYCIRDADGSTLKFPLCNIFSITEASE